jgi:putative spermidine/putrescine transport system substrate-binding protein
MTPGLEAVGELLDKGATIVSSSPELQTAFAQGGATLAAYAQDYAFTLQKAGLPVGFAQPEEGSPAFFITANVVANRPNVELAKKFVDFSIRAEAQAGWAEAMRYSPSNRDVVLPDQIAGALVYGEEAASRVMRFDPEVVNAERPAWTDAWNRAIAR